MDHNIKRSDAARFITDIAKTFAECKADQEKLNVGDFIQAMENAFARHLVPLPTKCNGEAHQPGIDYDHCGVCMPSWGWCVPKIKVK